MNSLNPEFPFHELYKIYGKNVLSLLLYRNITKKCFLCFSKNEATTNIFQDLFIQNEENYYKKTLFVIMKDTINYNFQDILIEVVCDDCFNLILKVHFMLNKHKMIKKFTNILLQILSKEIDLKSEMSLKNNDKRCDLNLNLSIEFTHELPASTEKEKIDLENSELKNKTHKCLKCYMNFKNMSSLRKHKSFVHKISNNSIICEICGKVCKSSSLLRAHSNCHKLKKCPHCAKLLKTHTHYYYHVKKHLTGVKKKSIRNTTYKCYECNYTSKNKRSLEAHMNKVHLNIRPYTCNVCSKGFYKKSNLVEHNTIHTKIKNDVCHICGDRFVNKKCLKEHIRVHTNEKPYKCDKCGDSFISAGRRTDHVKRKHVEKSELCILCGKIFSLKKDLDRHTKRVHKNVKTQELLQIDSTDINDLRLFDQTVT